VLSLKWEHVNFKTARMTIPSPKTEHHAGKAYRACPIFALLRPYLDEAFELAEEGAVYVVGGRQGDAYRATANLPGGWNNTNLRTTFEKIVRRAGLVQWPRLFHNLRASCETDLAADHPFHAVCSWLGNTPAVAVRHYLQVLDRDFDKASGHGSAANAEADARATQYPTRAEPATSRHETTAATGTQGILGSRRLLIDPDCSRADGTIVATGLEPVTSPV